MTSEVEKLILEKNMSCRELTLGEKNAYLLYEEIWKFILYSIKYDFIDLKIQFVVNKSKDMGYISKSNGINYETVINDIKYKWKTFYETCDSDKIINVLNQNIDFYLFFNLLREDKIYYNYLNDENMYVYIEMNKNDILKIINKENMRNKRLEKVVGKNDRIR